MALSGKTTSKFLVLLAGVLAVLVLHGLTLRPAIAASGEDILRGIAGEIINRAVNDARKKIKNRRNQNRRQQNAFQTYYSRCFNDSNHRSAIQNCTKALKYKLSRENNAQLFYMRAERHMAINNYRAAIRDYTKTLKYADASSFRAGTFYMRGLARNVSGNSAGARQDFQAALRIMPSFAEARDSLNAIEQSQRPPKRAINAPAQRNPGKRIALPDYKPNGKYPYWVYANQCSVLGSEAGVCLDSLKQCNGKDDFNCLQLGLCSYSIKGEVKSKNYCAAYPTFNSRYNHFLVVWANKNRIEIRDGGGELTMNGTPVWAMNGLSGNMDCYATQDNKEEFCFKFLRDFRFSGGLAGQTGLGGVWSNEPGVNCDSLAGGGDGIATIMTLENGLYEKQPVLEFNYDEYRVGEPAGIESDRCIFSNITRIGTGRHRGHYRCAGEPVDNAVSTLDRDEDGWATGMVMFRRNGLELTLQTYGRQQEWYQCTDRPSGTFGDPPVTDKPVPDNNAQEQMAMVEQVETGVPEGQNTSDGCDPTDAGHNECEPRVEEAFPKVFACIDKIKSGGIVTAISQGGKCAQLTSQCLQDLEDGDGVIEVECGFMEEAIRAAKKPPARATRQTPTKLAARSAPVDKDKNQPAYTSDMPLSPDVSNPPTKTQQSETIASKEPEIIETKQEEQKPRKQPIGTEDSVAENNWSFWVMGVIGLAGVGFFALAGFANRTRARSSLSMDLPQHDANERSTGPQNKKTKADTNTSSKSTKPEKAEASEKKSSRSKSVAAKAGVSSKASQATVQEIGNRKTESSEREKATNNKAPVAIIVIGVIIIVVALAMAINCFSYLSGFENASLYLPNCLFYIEGGECWAVEICSQESRYHPWIMWTGLLVTCIGLVYLFLNNKHLKEAPDKG